MSENLKKYKYKAFISYSHAADKKLAPSLQKALNQFNRPWYNPWAIRTFRDETNLAATPQLWSSIENALNDSEYFLLMASPLSSKSKWVRKEIDCWLENHSQDKFLIILTDGEDIVWDDSKNDFDLDKTNALPVNIQGKFKEEPRWLDLRWARTEGQLDLNHPKFRNDIIDISAELYDKDKDTLIGDNVRQQRQFKAVSILTILILLSLLIFASYQWWYANNQRRMAETQKKIAKQNELKEKRAKEELQNQLAHSFYVKGIEEASKYNNWPAGLLWFAKASALKPDNPKLRLATGFALEYLQFKKNLIIKHNDRIAAVHFSPDGKLLLTASMDNTACIWDVMKGKPIFRFIIHNGGVTSADFSPDGKYLLTASDDQTACVWNVQTGKLISGPMRHNNRIISASFSPDGKRILTTSRNDRTYFGETRVWDAKTGRLISSPIEAYLMGGARFSPNSKYIATWRGNKDYGEVRIWDSKTGKAISSPMKHSAQIALALFSPNSELIMTKTYRNENSKTLSQLWEVKSGEPISSPIEIDNAFFSNPFSPDGKKIATFIDMDTVQILDVLSKTKTPISLKHFTDKKFGVSSVNIRAVFRSGGKFLLTQTRNVVQVWNSKDGKPISPPLKHDSYVTIAVLDMNSEILLTASEDKAVCIWDISRANLLAPPFWFKAEIKSICLSPDGKSIAIKLDDNTVHIIKKSNSKPTIDVNSIILSPNCIMDP